MRRSNDVPAAGLAGCHTDYDSRMTRLSFRADDAEAARAQQWDERLGVDRSELLRTALRQHLTRLAGELDAQAWVDHPLGRTPIGDLRQRLLALVDGRHDRGRCPGGGAPCGE